MALASRYPDAVILGSKINLLARDVAVDKRLTNHPVLELFPSTRSFASYWLVERNSLQYALAILNPRKDFFDDHLTGTSIDHIVSIARQLVTFYPDGANKMPITIADEMAEQLAERVDFNHEPASRFLVDTLIKKQRLLGRKGCSYIALRQWRKPIKPYQLSALAALKATPDQRFDGEIATEMVGAIRKVFGDAFHHVVPIPPGSSGLKKGMSYRLAEDVARQLGVKFSDVLEGGPVARGASHPKKSAVLAPYKIKSEIDGNILIIDDVATSGRHVELATNAIRPMATYCTSLVWIAD